MPTGVPPTVASQTRWRLCSGRAEQEGPQLLGRHRRVVGLDHRVDGLPHGRAGPRSRARARPPPRPPRRPRVRLVHGPCLPCRPAGGQRWPPIAPKSRPDVPRAAGAVAGRTQVRRPRAADCPRERRARGRPRRPRRRPRGGARARPGADRRRRAGPVRPRRLGAGRRGGGGVLPARPPTRCRPCVRIARAPRPAVRPRGSGTGLAGGAVPVGDPVVIVTTKMDRILSIDPDERVAWVEPGRRQPRPRPGRSRRYGLHFAPDPSSQQACTIGGNVANNSGGPHCLAYGVTSAHVLAVEVVLPDGSVTVLGGLDPEPAGLRPAGRVRRAARARSASPPASPCGSRRNPPAVRTLLLDFPSVDDAAATVSGDHRRRHRARRARDDGPAHHRGGRGLRPRRATRPTPPPCCWSRSTACPAAVGRRPRPHRRDRPGPRRPDGAGGGRRRRAGRCCGRAASRRSAPSPGSRPTTTCTTRSCPAPGWSRCCAEVVRDRRAPRPRRDERLPRRRRQPPPAARCSTPASRA